MKVSEIRQRFLSYFNDKSHHVVASSPLIPSNDPSLLFTNAGMVQFKEVFLGFENLGFNRAVSAQRCVRAGGKHNDLENVGYTARHHTFFEMLGNFSFGDYFKRDAIQFAWQFLTQELAIPEERLWVTVYEKDQEAADIWLKEMKVSAERFSYCGDEDNFWSMGDTGPCGPCTEIFYDHGPQVEGGPPGSPEQEGDRYIEIWNLVFMQYDRGEDGTLSPLPKPSVDTGMGLERIAAVMQGVHSNYEIDLFQNLIQQASKIVACPDLNHVSLKVIADHIRSCAFLISDGVIPSNEGRGYVLRRIIRRAIRHGYQLGMQQTFFYRLVAPLVEQMGGAYQELIKNQAFIERVLEQEEQQFARTLEQGLRIFSEATRLAKDAVIDGETVFKLYDTYGFPADLTADMARERQLQVDWQGFEKAMERQRVQSRSASHFADQHVHALSLEGETQFKGYESLQVQTQINAILVDDAMMSSLDEGQQAILILDASPFYAESGGQVGDKGTISNPDFSFEVMDTQKKGQVILHFGKLARGRVSLGQTVLAKVESDTRQATALNHSATHLLHSALRKILGEHVQQKGSLVDDQRLRFDFSHFEALSNAQRLAIENLVNVQIRADLAVQTDLMSPEEAKSEGAMALFGEKYGKQVRVLSMGAFSKELCGGTHVMRTGEIGLFVITLETSIASGIRRIEAITGKSALAWVQSQQQILQQCSEMLRCEARALPQKLQELQQDKRVQEKELLRLQNKQASQTGEDLIKLAKPVNGIPVIVQVFDGQDMKGLRNVLDGVKTRLEQGVIVLIAKNDDRINVIANVSKALNQRLSAKQLVQSVCDKGGGRPDMAQGGGALPVDFKQRIESIYTIVEQQLQ